jgi:hypothetical protein
VQNFKDCLCLILIKKDKKQNKKERKKERKKTKLKIKEINQRCVRLMYKLSVLKIT